MKPSPRSLKWVGAIALVLIIGLGANLALNWAARLPGLAVKGVVVKGELRRVKREGFDVLAARVVKGNFFTLDIHNVQNEFESLPWVRSASVRRVWPDQLEVRLEEHVPLARWGTEALVNEQGELFRAAYSGELPRFIGPEGSEKEMTAAYLQFQRQLREDDRQAVELVMSPRRAWSIKLESGMVLELGRTDMRERLARFVSVDKLMSELKERRGHVDLRYPNGFALKLLGPAKNKENLKATQ